MQVKIDTREKFHVITLQESSLPANMTEILGNKLLGFLQMEVKNIVINLEKVTSIDNNVVQTLIAIQNEFEATKVTFITCCLQAGPAKQLADNGLLKQLNQVPTQSEACEIVMMDEIERELGLGGEEELGTGN